MGGRELCFSFVNCVKSIAIMRTKGITDRMSDPADPADCGIALCMGMLADEAADHGLQETSLAIRQAIAVFLVETAGRSDAGDDRVH